MIGCRLADLIKASGHHAAPTGRMDGCSQDRHAKTSHKTLAEREASMDGPSEQSLTAAGLTRPLTSTPLGRGAASLYLFL